VLADYPVPDQLEYRQMEIARRRKFIAIRLPELARIGKPIIEHFNAFIWRFVAARLIRRYQHLIDEE
jgi:hypothetical protein